MVVDEELKMMSAVCSDGGRITGPHLKEMSRLTHTEYVLRGRSRLDPRDILRETMFAPTVTGSPMQNACTVITRHERTPRGYYSGVAALFTPAHATRSWPGEPTHDLDAPILIRTAYLADGRLRVPGRRDARAPLRPVRRGQRDARQGRGRARRDRRDPARPTAPSRRCRPAPSTRTRRRPSRAPLADDPAIASLLASRNARLASFWLNPQDAARRGPVRRPLGARRRRRGPLHDDARAPAAPPRTRRRDRRRGARSPTPSSTTPSSSCRGPDPATRAISAQRPHAADARGRGTPARRPAGRCSRCA